MLKTLSELDIEILSYINKLSTGTYDLFWLYATNPLTWTPLFLWIFYLIYTKFNRRETLIVLISIVLTLSVTLLCTLLVKEWVMRPRPHNNLEISGVLRVLEPPQDYSFFSGHASSSMAVATLVVLFLRHKAKRVYIFFLWPLLFSFSRLYMCVHYPSDIVAGIVAGGIFGASFYLLAAAIFLKNRPHSA